MNNPDAAPSSDAVPPLLPNVPPGSAQPTSKAERYEAIDVLRGCALFGILLVNMAFFSQPVEDLMMIGPVWSGRLDVATDWLVRFLAEGKSYGLFSFLFGLGFALQRARVQAQGTQFLPLYVRRLLVLLVIGLLHAFLIWEGDILVWYAVSGFLLLPFGKRKPQTLLVWVVLCLLSLPAVLWSAWGAYRLLAGEEGYADLLAEHADDAESYASAADEKIRIFGTGTYGEIFTERVDTVLEFWAYAFFQAPLFFAMFLLGVYVARLGFVQRPEEHLAIIKRTCMAGLVLGALANAVYAAALNGPYSADIYSHWLVAITALSIGGPCFCLFLVTAVVLAQRSEGWAQRFFPGLAAAGRMALTNYLLQSAICTTIFYSYGLGLYGALGRAEGVALAAFIFASQLCLSVWWLRHFERGPIEWLWRTLTYLSVPGRR